MTRMTKAQQAEQQESKERLLDHLNPGDTIFCILRHCSASGMSRVISLIVIRDDRPLFLSWNAAKVLGWRYDNKREGIIVDGCGMDMGFHTVYILASRLFGDGYKLDHKWL